MKFLPLLTLWNFVAECGHNAPNMVSLFSGNISNMGKSYMSFREADEGEL
jgi:hypothetical protein